ncbi:MAG: phosphopantetheine-binding protein [Candidatus Moraniibacteriota bacterium]
MEEKVRELIARTLKKNPEDILLTTNIDDLAEDSIALFTLISAFEKEFGVETEYKELINIETVGDIVLYLENILKR